MRTFNPRFALVALFALCMATGCRNGTTRDDPFNQRRIIAPPPAGNYAPPAVQVPGVNGAPLQPVPGAQSGAQPGMFRPASATSPLPASTDGWVPADKPASAQPAAVQSAPPPDHSARLSKATQTPSLQPVTSAQPAQPSPGPASDTTAALGWTPPRMP